MKNLFCFNLRHALICFVVVAFHLYLFAGEAGETGVALPVKGVYLSTDGVRNFKSFLVEASAAERYYCNFWLQPAMYDDGSFAKYTVYVNGGEIGEIRTKREGWQQASIYGVPAVTLDKGVNVITIAAQSPEIPDAEMVRLSADRTVSQFSSDAYDGYVKKAQQAAGCIDSDDAGLPAAYSGVSVVPLKYSFYKTFSFQKGDEINLKSSGNIPHVIDLFYCGQPLISGLLPSVGGSSGGNTIPGTDIVSGPGDTDTASRIKSLYVSASSEEMQGLSWKRSSEPDLKGSVKHIAVMNVKIPKSGVYMAKLRSAENGALGVADFMVGGSMAYVKSCWYLGVPVYYYHVDDVFPADGNKHEAYALGLNPDTDDTMLFVEGNAADRIVGYNDEAPAEIRDNYSMCAHDSYLSQVYKVKTTGLHVSNYWSYAPESECVVKTPDHARADGMAEAVALQHNMMLRRAAPPSPIGLSGNVMERSLPINFTDVGNIMSVQVFSLQGTKIADFGGGRCKAGLSVSDFGGKSGSVYIFAVQKKSGTEVYKILVK